MMRREHGFTLIEIVAAAMVLLVGVLATFYVFESSQALTLTSERQSVLAHRATLELERIKSLPYSQVALTGTSSSWSTNPNSYTYVGGPNGGSGLSGTCPANSNGAAPTYQPDHSQGGSSAFESLVINGCTYTLNGSTSTVSGGTIAPVTPWSAGGVTGTTYDFVTWTSDPTCSQTSTPGSNCPTTNDYKRITIVVTVNGSQPTKPAILTAYLTPPNSSTHDPLDGVGTQCVDANGNQVSCTGAGGGSPGPPQSLCDESYTNSSCGSGPPCSGNTLHDTLYAVGATAATPDLLGSSDPTESCTPNPPCFATDAGCGSGCTSNCGGLPIPPTPPPSSGSPCVTPPTDNQHVHSWVSQPLPSNTSITYTGWGSFTGYWGLLNPSNGASVNATICVGVYVVPQGVLGSVSGNLLATQIGVAASPTVTIGSIVTPYTFNFNLGRTYTIDTSVLSQARIEFIVWVVAAAGSPSVSLYYDQAQFASQIELQQG